MCVLAFAWRAHPRWPLVVAGNRDELHARPAAALARWEEAEHLIAGRDLQAGGTWLGVSERGRFAVVTNLRAEDAPEPGRPSRGNLVSGLLEGEGPLGDIGRIDLTGFNPFNLIFADKDQAWFLSNRPEPVRRPLAPGVFGLSNGALDEPWAKTLRLKDGLGEWLAKGVEEPERLLDVLADETLATGGIAPALPSDAPLEPPLSPIFIRNPVYGTRCSTVVAIDDRGRGIIAERRYNAKGEADGETRLSFAWPG